MRFYRVSAKMLKKWKHEDLPYHYDYDIACSLLTKDVMDLIEEVKLVHPRAYHKFLRFVDIENLKQIYRYTPYTTDRYGIIAGKSILFFREIFKTVTPKVNKRDKNGNLYLTEASRLDVVNKYIKGKSINEIMDEYECSFSTISKILDRVDLRKIHYGTLHRKYEEKLKYVEDYLNGDYPSLYRYTREKQIPHTSMNRWLKLYEQGRL